MDVHGNPRKSKKVHGRPWASMEFAWSPSNAPQWASHFIDIHEIIGDKLEFMGINKLSWECVLVSKHPMKIQWTSLGINGSPWKFKEIHGNLRPGRVFAVCPAGRQLSVARLCRFLKKTMEFYGIPWKSLCWGLVQAYPLRWKQVCFHLSEFFFALFSARQQQCQHMRRPRISIAIHGNLPPIWSGGW